jgi:hypothetical protein
VSHHEPPALPRLPRGPLSEVPRAFVQIPRDPARQCRVGADCASGLCASDGTCATAAVPEGGTDGGGPTDDAMVSADGSGPETSSDAAISGCSPNNDGTITREEVPIAAGLHATYKIGSNEDLPAGYVTGVVGAGGKRTWDFSAPLASDVGVLVETQSLKGKYYETTYPNATYATKLSNSSDLLGVFETSPGALLLRGVVSPAMGGTNGSNGTQLTYTPGVSILAFPLIINGMWSTDSAATGTAAGFPLTLAAKTQEKYDSKVDAAGTLKTPLGTFDVLRVQVLLTRTVGTPGITLTTVTTVRTFAFVTECYGTIATVTSKDNETEAEFTHAFEIRRISP